MRPLRDVLDESNPNKTADANRLLRAGSAAALLPRTARVVVVAGTGVGLLPELAKAAQILRCYVSAGGVTGYFTPLKGDATPATTQVAISPTGDLLFLAADAVTEAEVVYVGDEGEIFEDVLVVAGSNATLPLGRRAVRLLSAEVLTGLVLGAKAIDDRGTAAGAGEATLSVTGAIAQFNATDVVAGTARVRYIAFPGDGTGTPEPIGAVLDTDVGF